MANNNPHPPKNPSVPGVKATSIFGGTLPAVKAATGMTAPQVNPSIPASATGPKQSGTF